MSLIMTTPFAGPQTFSLKTISIASTSGVGGNGPLTGTLLAGQVLFAIGAGGDGNQFDILGVSSLGRLNSGSGGTAVYGAMGYKSTPGPYSVSTANNSSSTLMLVIFHDVSVSPIGTIGSSSTGTNSASPSISSVVGNGFNIVVAGMVNRDKLSAPSIIPGFITARSQTNGQFAGSCAIAYKVIPLGDTSVAGTVSGSGRTAARLIECRAGDL